jgi:hypothetical protein
MATAYSASPPWRCTACRAIRGCDLALTASSSPKNQAKQSSIQKAALRKQHSESSIQMQGQWTVLQSRSALCTAVRGGAAIHLPCALTQQQCRIVHGLQPFSSRCQALPGNSKANRSLDTVPAQALAQQPMEAGTVSRDRRQLMAASVLAAAAALIRSERPAKAAFLQAPPGYRALVDKLDVGACHAQLQLHTAHAEACLGMLCRATR